MASDLQEIMKELRRKAAMQPRVKNASHFVCMQGMEYAFNISPVLTGDFRESWAVKDYPARFEGDIPMSQLVNTDDGAVSIEYGTKDTPPHHVLVSTRTYMQELADEEERI